MSHTCPARGCPSRVGDDMLMCRKHWFMAPASLRADVWRAYRRHGVGSEELADAQLAAIAAVDEQLAEASA
jgi:hypothetical protein